MNTDSQLSRRFETKAFTLSGGYVCSAVILVFTGASANWALGQSSSLFLSERSGQFVGANATSQPVMNGAAAAGQGAVREVDATGNGLPAAAPTQTSMMQVNAGAAAPVGPIKNEALAQFSLTAITLPEPKAIQVNDFIGVIIRHRFRYQSDAQLNQKNEWENESKLEAWFRIHDRKWLQQDFAGGAPEVKFSHENEMKNRGKKDRSDTFETRIMAKVLDVKPNGSLVLTASHDVTIDDEQQVIMFTGECSKEDIAANRTITSDKIYGLKVWTTHGGAVEDATKRGWLKEIYDKAKAF